MLALPFVPARPPRFDAQDFPLQVGAGARLLLLALTFMTIVPLRGKPRG